MASNVETLLEEVALHLATLASDADVAKAIEQTLTDMVGALEKLKTFDGSDIVKAIAGLKLTVNVSPTPLNINVQPTPFEIVLPPAKEGPVEFKPLRFIVNRNVANGLTDFIDVVEITP